MRGFTDEQVAHNQRERMLAACAELVAANGYGSVTVAHITKAAQVSRRTFYEQFDDRSDCFLATFDLVVEHLHRLIDGATESVPGWPQKVAAAMDALLGFFVAEPDLAKLALVDSLTAGPKAAERYQEVVAGFVPLLKPGRLERRTKGEIPDSTEDTIIGSLGSVITREILAGRAGQLEDLHADLVTFVLTPYMGAARAAKVAARASASAR